MFHKENKECVQVSHVGFTLRLVWSDYNSSRLIWLARQSLIFTSMALECLSQFVCGHVHLCIRFFHRLSSPPHKILPHNICDREGNPRMHCTEHNEQKKQVREVFLTNPFFIFFKTPTKDTNSRHLCCTKKVQSTLLYK